MSTPPCNTRRLVTCTSIPGRDRGTGVTMISTGDAVFYNVSDDDDRRSRVFQKSCIDFTIQARPLERYMPKDRNSMKYKIWRLVVSTPFEYFIMILIVLNTLLLMMKVMSSASLDAFRYTYYNMSYMFNHEMYRRYWNVIIRYCRIVGCSLNSFIFIIITVDFLTWYLVNLRAKHQRS